MEEYLRPKTIEELKQFCADKGMPLEQMRFFIGEDYREPRAFGIYQDENGEFVVYKNKSDGSRAVRYQGPDEAYAVNELYEKLKSEVENRRGGGAATRSGRKELTNKIPIVVLAAYMAINLAFNLGPWIQRLTHHNKPRGYYRYESQTYYYDYSDWYLYDELLDDWIYWDAGMDWSEEPREYFLSERYSDDYGVGDFADSEYYVEDTDTFDWGSSSDYDSWDSSDTDWDSDW